MGALLEKADSGSLTGACTCSEPWCWMMALRTMRLSSSRTVVLDDGLADHALVLWELALGFANVDLGHDGRKLVGADALRDRGSRVGAEGGGVGGEKAARREGAETTGRGVGGGGKDGEGVLHTCMCSPSAPVAVLHVDHDDHAAGACHHDVGERGDVGLVLVARGVGVLVDGDAVDPYARVLGRGRQEALDRVEELGHRRFPRVRDEVGRGADVVGVDDVGAVNEAAVARHLPRGEEAVGDERFGGSLG
eukprot:310194-Chlamydomonas_euryale.AAC.2